MRAVAEVAGVIGGVPWAALGLVVVLLVVNAGFVAVEIGLLAARRSRIEAAAEAGDRRGALVLRSFAEPAVTFTGAQLGITLCSLGLGAVAGPALVVPLARVFGPSALSGTTGAVLAVALALTLLTGLHLVVGELVPRHLAVARGEAVALTLARPFRGFVLLARPLLRVLNRLATLLVRAVRMEPVDEQQLAHSPGELVLAVSESLDRGTITDTDARVMRAALELAGITAEAAMTARVDLAAVPDDATGAAVLELAGETGYTRFPVFHDDIDQVVGLVHVKDLLTSEEFELDTTPVSELLRPIVAVPGSRDLEHLLQDMLDRQTHAVLVTDEFGGTAGLLTLEDVLEELVGEIADEYDDEEHVDRSRGRYWTVPGTVRRDEVERLAGLVLSGGSAETVSGWLVERLGRLVHVGDRVTTEDDWVLTVRSLDGRRAGEVELRAPSRTDQLG